MSYQPESYAQRVTGFLTLVAALLVVAHLIGLLLDGAVGNSRYAASLIRRFDLDEESNIPTFFNSVLLLVSATLLMVAGDVARSEGSKWVSHWRWLALIFTYLAIDETCELHGFFTELNQIFDTGIFRFAWVLVYGPLVMVLGLVYLRFMLALPSDARVRFSVAAAIYVGGALGMEIVGGAWSRAAGEDNAIYRGITTIEETMELAGLIVFVHALLLHTQLRFSAGRQPQPGLEVPPAPPSAAEPRVAIGWPGNGSRTARRAAARQ